MRTTNAKVVVHEVPVPKPPATYDFVGLSFEEASVIATLLGKCATDAPKAVDTYPLYEKLPPELKYTNYRVVADGLPAHRAIRVVEG